MQVHTLGKTVLGRPFLAVFISDSATLKHLDRYQMIQRKLMNPLLRGKNELEPLLAAGKNIILITSAIHSTESGGFTTPLVLTDRLARGDTPEARAILANTIIILVPSQNPDGVDIVGDWYRSTLGTKSEGTSPPELYHHYVGHDDNRDWYAFTQPETRYTVDSLYTPWDPEIVNDIHQQGSNAGRIFLPPYMDPLDPNIDPILTAGTNAMGMAIGWRMIAEGKTGIAYNAAYDQWSPARQYSLYHRGVRILTETASAALATPIDIPFTSLGAARGYEAKTVTWNFPALWPGGQLELRRHRRLSGERELGDAESGRARPPRVARELRRARRPRARGRSPVDARQRPRGIRDSPDAARHAGRAAADLDAAARAGGGALEHDAGERERRDLSRGIVRGAHLAADGRLREVACSNGRSIRTCTSIPAARRSARTT